MSSSLSNKLITITGAASGIGLATARTLARRGALLSLADYNASNLKKAHDELAALSNSKNIISTSLDIRNTSSVNDWISTTRKHFNRSIDGCANIAGFHPLWMPKNIEEIKDDEFEEVMQINTTGLFKCLRAQLAPDMLSTPASIVNVGSVAGLVGLPGDSAYCAAKHAVHGLTRAASRETGKRNIRVNAVAPGHTDTPMYHATVDADVNLEAISSLNLLSPGLGRLAAPEEIAEAIVWLLSEESSYVSGSIYKVDGGLVDY